MSELEALLSKHGDRLEDFWGRRENAPRFSREIVLFGRLFRFSSNHAGVLTAVDECAPLYSLAPPSAEPPFAVQLVARGGPIPPGPPPEELFDHIRYVGEGAWLSLQLGRWGHGHVDMAAGSAIAVLEPELAARPDIVARCLLNTVITNLFIGNGYAMLHASCLVRAGRALLLMAPHNSGKSTTALRLAMAGYRLLSDSMVFLAPGSAQLLGFPVGRAKLRRDMVAEFPQLEPLLAVEYVRAERKYAVDLRGIDPGWVHEGAAQPQAIELALLSRGERQETIVWPATRAEVMDAVMGNSLFYDSSAIWRRNLQAIAALVDRAHWHHLAIGSSAQGIVKAVDDLWATPGAGP